MRDKIYKNALLFEQVARLNKEEKQKVIIELLKNTTERKLAEEINIPRATIHDWKTLRQDNTGSSIHININTFYRKLISLEAKDVTDWGRLQQIRDRINILLRHKK